MASKKDNPIGQEELSVLQYVQQEHPVTVREVADHFADAGKARTTILTVMERLRAKGFLARKKQSGSFRYSPKLSGDEVMKSVVGDFVQKMLGGSLSPFVAYMSQTEDLSDDDLKELKKLVRDLDKTRKEKSDE